MPSTESYPLSLHDALPICIDGAGGLALVSDAPLEPRLLDEAAARGGLGVGDGSGGDERGGGQEDAHTTSYGRAATASPSVVSSDRKSTRLNSSHVEISYAVHRVLPSFPTRRSSDLHRRRGRARPCLRRAPRATASRRGGSAGWPGRGRRERRRRARRRPGGCAYDVIRTRSDGFSLGRVVRSEEHTSELQSRRDLVCRPPSPTLFPYTTLFRSASTARAGSPLSPTRPSSHGFSTRRQRGVAWAWATGAAATSAAAARRMRIRRHTDAQRRLLPRSCRQIGRAHV